MHASSDEIPLDLRGTSFDPTDIFDIDLGHFGAGCCGGGDASAVVLPQSQPPPVPQAMPSVSSVSHKILSSATDTASVQVSFIALMLTNLQPTSQAATHCSRVWMTKTCSC